MKLVPFSLSEARLAAAAGEEDGEEDYQHYQDQEQGGLRLGVVRLGRAGGKVSKKRTRKNRNR